MDDWEFVTKRNLLVPLPRKPNVEDILSSYRSHYLSSKKDQKASRPPAVLDEVLDGLKAYFNKALGNNLLYRFERAQYVQQRKDWNVAQEGNEDKAMEPSKVYGAEHLLRLFGMLLHAYFKADHMLTSFISHLPDNSQSPKYHRSHNHGCRIYSPPQGTLGRIPILYGKGAKEFLCKRLRSSKLVLSSINLYLISAIFLLR